MKKLLITFAFILFFLSQSFSQQVYSEYNSGYFLSKYNLEVSFDEKDTSKFDIWMNAESTDDLVAKTGLMVSSKNIDAFQKSLKQLSEKYVEWSNIAKTNNVQDLKKDFGIEIPQVGAFFYYSNEWEFDYSVNITAKFFILKNTKGELFHLLLMQTGELISSSNEFIKSKGLYIALSSKKEIDDFITAVSRETIMNFKNKPKPEDLFK